MTAGLGEYWHLSGSPGTQTRGADRYKHLANPNAGRGVDLAPDACSSPANEAIVASRTATKDPRQIAPWRT